MSRQSRAILRPSTGSVAALLAAVALAVVAIVSIDLIDGNVPSLASGKGGTVGPAITPTPSNVVIVPPDPRSKVPGSIVYVKAGNIWIQSGTTAQQLTNTGADSMPSFSPDGAWIYYIQTDIERGRYDCVGGVVANYTMAVPRIERVHPDGSGASVLASGSFSRGDLTWFYFLRQPVVSPDGKRLALVSDAPTPCADDVVLQFFNLATHRLSSANAPDTPPLGHQDPAWSPDGSLLLYVRNQQTGSRGTPIIERYVVKTGKTTALTGPGYLQPSWSPDGRYVAVTHLDSFGSDVEILDARNGHELARVTSDDASTAPVWSPAGDAIAYLHIESGVTDLRMVTLSGTGPNWTIGQPISLTELSGLDPGSRPSWFVPADQLPTSPPSVAPSPATTL